MPVRVCSQLADALSNEVDAVIPLIEARLKALDHAGKAFAASDDAATSQVGPSNRPEMLSSDFFLIQISMTGCTLTALLRRRK